jgi:cytochrome c-type biogenesis protein CcmE
MTRKRRRLYLVLGGLATLGIVSALVLNAMSDSLVFFYSPTDLIAKHVPDGRLVRIGGLVQQGSVQRAPDGRLDFRVTDGRDSVAVDYHGVVPDLFREGQGVVVEGALEKNGTFLAQDVLAKHDENYMPREVVDALKKAGRWQEGGDGAASAASAAKTGMAQ